MRKSISLLRVHRFWSHLGRAAWGVRGPKFLDETTDPKIKKRLELRKSLRQLEGKLLLMKASDHPNPEKIKFLLKYITKLRRYIREA